MDGCEHDIKYIKNNGRYACIKCGISKEEIDKENKKNTDTITSSTITKHPKKTRGRKKGIAITITVLVIVVVVFHFGSVFTSIDLSEIPIPDNIYKALTPEAILTESDISESQEPETITNQELSDSVVQDIDEQQMHQTSNYLILDAINDMRNDAGLDAISLGNNNAAQIHAEDMFEGCFMSHWGTTGLKPYMRYSLAGGYNTNTEVILNTYECLGGKPVLDGSEAVEMITSNPAYQRILLDPHNELVNIGEVGGHVVVLQFEHGKTTFSKLPNIKNGVLSFTMMSEDFKGHIVKVYYDEPPINLSTGQLSYTECYDDGIPIASIRLGSIDSTLPANEQLNTIVACTDPTKHPSSLPAPTTLHDAEKNRLNAKTTSTTKSYIVPWLIAYTWNDSDNSFIVEGNIAHILDEYGDGVYTVRIFGWSDGTLVPASAYSIFHGVPEPLDYN